MELQEFTPIEGGALAPEGFLGAAVHCGIKAQPVPDLALLVSERLAAGAATLTRNRLRAAPTYVTEAHLADGRARAIVANSGNANCATGAQGLRNARRMAEATAQLLGVAAEEVLVCSTGLIGYQLPIERIEAALPQLAASLSRAQPELLARGIMTTDTFPKLCAVETELGSCKVRIGGIAKGAGMIAPNMATMLCFLTTDAALTPALLKDSLRWAVERSFNCLSVDGCMSTNDTVIVLANGASGAPLLTSPETADAQRWRSGLLAVCQELAKMIARDGEGATKLITVRVGGARSFWEARRAAKAVANYTLLKVALHGEQFNWGRVMAALGSALVNFDPARISVALAGIRVWAEGEPQSFDPAQAAQALAGKEISIDIDLAQGAATAQAWTCDLSEAYIRENIGPEKPPGEKGD